jgi:hypothetical protein
MRLFREAGLGRLELGFGLDALMLTADLTEPMTAGRGRWRTRRRRNRPRAWPP